MNRVSKTKRLLNPLVSSNCNKNKHRCCRRKNLGTRIHAAVRHPGCSLRAERDSMHTRRQWHICACVRAGRTYETPSSVYGQVTVGSIPELEVRLQVLVRSLSGRTVTLQVQGAPGSKALWGLIAQKTSIPKDHFGFIIGCKLLRRERGLEQIDLARDVMITTTAGLRGGTRKREAAPAHAPQRTFCVWPVWPPKCAVAAVGWHQVGQGVSPPRALPEAPRLTMWRSCVVTLVRQWKDWDQGLNLPIGSAV